MSASAKKKLRKEEQTAQMTEKQLAQQKEAKKLKTVTTIFVVAIVLVLIASLTIAGLNFYKGSGYKEKHAIAAEIGDYQLNGVEMNYYYVDNIESQYQEWSASYGDNMSLFLSLMGLDPTMPLSQQNYSEELTWADYFVDMALNNARSDYLLSEKAKAEGFTITEETQQTLNNTVEMLPSIASIYGYPDVDTYLHAMYGPGASLDSYRAYAEKNALAADYYNAYAENLSIDDAAIRAHEEGKYDEYSSFSYANYTISYNSFLTGGTKAEDGTTTYSEEEKDAARAAAKTAVESLPQCSSVEELNAAIAAIPFTTDVQTEATVRNNTLYASLNTNARQWMADGSRQVGDFTTIANETVSTDGNDAEATVVNSYTAYVYLGRNDNTKPMANIRHILVKFAGGTADENGNTVYSDAEKAAAREEAEKLLQTYTSGAQTQEAFAELAIANSDDAYSSANGGLIEHITTEPGVYVESFTNWANDPSRKAEDVEIIESEYGYHIMYYVGDDELTYRDFMIHEEILETTHNAWYNDILNTAEIVKKDTSLLNMDIILSN